MTYRRGGRGGRGGLGGLGGLGAVSLSSAGRRDRGKAARAYRKMRLESAGEQAAHVLPTPTPSLSSTDAPSLTPAHSHSEPMRPNSGRQSSVQAVIAIFDGRLSASAPPPSSRPSTVRVNVPPPPLSLKRPGLPSPPRSGSLSTLPVGVASGGEAPNNDVAAIDAGAAVPRRKITGSRRPSRPSGGDFTGNPCLQFLAQPGDSNITRRHSWPSLGVPQFPLDAVTAPRPESCPPLSGSPAAPSSVGAVTTPSHGARQRDGEPDRFAYYSTSAAVLAKKHLEKAPRRGAAVATYLPEFPASVANYGHDTTGLRPRLPTPPPSTTPGAPFGGGASGGGASGGQGNSDYEEIEVVMDGGGGARRSNRDSMTSFTAAMAEVDCLQRGDTGGASSSRGLVASAEPGTGGSSLRLAITPATHICDRVKYQGQLIEALGLYNEDVIANWWAPSSFKSAEQAWITFFESAHAACVRRTIEERGLTFIPQRPDFEVELKQHMGWFVFNPFFVGAIMQHIDTHRTEIERYREILDSKEFTPEQAQGVGGNKQALVKAKEVFDSYKKRLVMLDGNIQSLESHICGNQGPSPFNIGVYQSSIEELKEVLNYFKQKYRHDPKKQQKIDHLLTFELLRTLCAYVGVNM